ncbi:MAG: FAD-dependent oxidoreductase [Litorivicinus sp.]
MIKVDNLIIGGGVAALWLNAQARLAGLNTLLVAPDLGGGQSLLSQGIIHGGTKYALQGSLTGASEAIKAMPQRWLDALAGTGPVDLSEARIASDAQLMIHNASMGGKLVQFFASKALRGRVERITPPAFLNPKDRVYRLAEPVIDTASVLAALATQAPCINDRVVGFDAENRVVTLQTGRTIQCENAVLLAGEGNEALLTAAGHESPSMQRRPLQMLVGQGELPPLWAHVVGTGAKPLATITTHAGYWYVGGDIAERGADMTEQDFLQWAPAALAGYLPSVDLSSIKWSGVRVNRAEPAQGSGQRPDSAFIQNLGWLTVGWPTKLALAPALADAVMPNLARPTGTHSVVDSEAIALAPTPWHRT